MGQTLTHGVYLPDEGERNCYSGLAGNWQILDTSVGTIAANTAALAEKAPLVHTHVKSDITDFPAYGNAAGTICEGNDSRLSDARTPVAHTHTKSDVTDLLNSDFIPSANNSYDLGSSSYQWNNLYAKNYYYNGTAWGLDKANQWSSEQTCKSNSPKWINQNTNITMGVAPASNQTCAFYNYDKNGNEIGRLISRVQSDGKTVTWISAANLYKNGAIDPTGSSVWANLYCAVDTNGYPHVSTDCALTPNVNNTYDLGTSTNKWKTLNGVNPGALSLPDNSVYYSFNTDDFVYTGAYNEVTVPKKGWLYLRLVECNQDAYIACSSANGNVDYPVFSVGTILNQNTSKYEVNFLMPLSVTTFRLYIYKTQGTLTQHKVFYTEGMIQ